ncbi:hypothetical protein IKD57_01710 [Candidatus Saccharibacteria bacterium]|nr:hypothetical protein [Candidatus Saccharibacteria bacterium]
MKKLLLSLVAIIMGGFVAFTPIISSTPTFAAEEEKCICHYKDGTTKEGTKPATSILDGACECGGGESVTHILEVVVDILTVGIGILAAIGITIVGIQYLTAGGSEEQTRKAKRRMLEIVIGVAAYVVLYAILKWLLPAYNPSS